MATTNRTGPLAGVTVLEFAGQGPAPYCGMLLADLGASVVRLDRPAFAGDVGMDPRYNLLNRGKRSLQVDLRHPGANALVLDLVAKSDVVLEGYRPGVMEKLGLSPERCLAANPALVYGRMTGWGQEGPYAQMAGHDVNYISITGALASIGQPGGAPEVPLNLVGDFGGGGAFLAIGVLAALREAAVTGAGQTVDAAIVDGATHLLSVIHAMLNVGRWTDERGANFLDGSAPYYSTYCTRDGEYLSVGAIEPKFFAEFIRIAGIDFDPAEPYSKERWPALRALITAKILTRTRAEWQEIFDGTDACVSPVLSLREAAAHPHLKARQTLVANDDGLQPSIAPRLSNHDATPPPLFSSPLPGEHTREILAEYGLENIDSLLDSGVVSAVQADTANAAKG